MDHTMPRADDLPDFEVDLSAYTRCSHNPLGARGCGEAGAIGSPAAFVSAVVDAIRRGGHAQLTHIDMPPTLARIWSAIHQG